VASLSAEEKYSVHAGLIPDGVFHKVKNTEKFLSLYFVCVFDGKRYDNK